MGQHATKHQPSLVRNGQQKGSEKGSAGQKRGGCNAEKPFFEPQKELEGAGRGRQGKSSLHLQSKERARGNRKTRSIRKLKDKDENLTSTQISWTPG